MVNDTNCQVMVISGLIFQLMVINVVKTMPFLPPIGPWEWFIYTTYKNGDAGGMVYYCFNHISNPFPQITKPPQILKTRVHL